MGRIKITKSQKRHAFMEEGWTSVMMEGPRNSHYLAKSKPGQEPLVFLANKRTLIQQLVPAASTSRLPRFAKVPSVSDELLASDDLGEYSFDNDLDFGTTPLSPRKADARDSPTKRGRHRANLVSQVATWQNKIIPPLVCVFTRLWHKTRGLRDADKLAMPSREECSCQRSVKCKISVVQFTKITDLETWTCACAPAPTQLLAAGLFPSAPIRPTLAVDVRVLEFAMKLFVRIAPNNTAWTSTLESFLDGLGFTLEHEGSLRKMFAISLEWYTHLRHRVQHHFDDVLEDTRLLLLPETADQEHSSDGRATPIPRAPAAASMHPPSTPRGERGRQSRRVFVSWLWSRSSSTSRSLSSSPTPGASNNKRKRRRAATPEAPQNPFPEPPPRTRSSEYLCRRCPACFGGVTHDPSAVADVFVCIDACYTQKRNSGTVDPPKTHPATHFVSEGLSAEMEDYVDGVRATKPSAKRARKATLVDVEDAGDDAYEHPALLLPPSVLNGCESSFKAADEKREKASSQFYDDTALMALLCRHDRMLWLVNMHSAGEKQFNVYLLLETLFQHLPRNITVGLLYDIACQLERSARKWGFLDRYIDRLVFAVAVFHAFGHEWACQVIYHPRKREGFGFTNGEGCERFWHSISHLIAHLRISSYHHRLYTLDTQIQHADEANLFKLAEWIQRRGLHSAAKRAEAQAVLKKCGHDLPLLRAERTKQVAAQTKPLTRRSKTAGEKAVAAVIATREALEIRKAQVNACEAAALDAIEDDDSPEEIVHRKVALTAARAALVALNKIRKNKYIELRINAHALKRRLRDRLRARKFERDRVERSSRRQQASEQKLLAHTDSAVKRREPQISHLKNDYNKLCDAIVIEIREKRAPRGAVAPERINTKALYALDVDDAIWQDVGLQDEGQKEPPLWLSSDSVCSGIRAMLDLDRAHEEDGFLARERESLRVWFAEEWTIVNAAMQAAASDDDCYQFHLRRERLLRLCGTWRRYMPEEGPDDTPWGPSEDELMDSLLASKKAGRGEDGYQAPEEGKTEDEEEEDFETLDALDTADVYRDAYGSGGSDSDDDSD
ncbi:hypothetical protein B0H17DRAFT_1130398 [Mycena rosella]|uniref:CxC2-like cysteine cluster KDZ transposase-associated domain-containing protein n=1 Tax=Mycena rosella TaxID=1033263 RepID=A0AAD7DR56_MYCRO|nr:hypothetical protein B0H17DRAFT_1130398 [Mycena rosella]